MNKLRFQVGEVAISVVATQCCARGHEGDPVEVLMVGPFAKDRPIMIGGRRYLADRNFDYLIRWQDSDLGCVHDWQLRKIDPPVEPVSITRRKEVAA